jgi:UDP-N-acetylglucosamine acyltransferase
MFDTSCTIDPTAKIIGEVRMGRNNQILPYTILIGPLTIGDNNIIGPHVVIGSPGQDTRNPRYDSTEKPIAIGSGNIIREFTAIQKPCYEEITRLGSNIYLMQSVHIPHDAVLEDNVVITPMVVLAGIVTIMEGANLAMGCSVHQRTIVGPYSIAAQGAALVKNVKPFSRHIPGKQISVNQYAIDKYGFTEFTDEITAYVLHNQIPKSETPGILITKYERLHFDSGRPQY